MERRRIERRDGDCLGGDPIGPSRSPRPPRFRGARAFAILAACAALCAVGAGTALAGTLPAGQVWSTGFSGGSDSGDFNVPSDGGTHGNCARTVAGGAAWYTHVGSASDGGATRCYPAQLWAPDYFHGVVARGRFWLNVNPSEVGNSEWLSFLTLSLHPEGLITLNLKVDSTGPTAGKPRLLLWHVPTVGQGDQTRHAYLAFPLRQWVEIVVTLTPGGAIEVRQDGTLILSGQKRDAPGDVEAAHFGGYASGPVSGWVIGNDDLRIQSHGTVLPPLDGRTPPPVASPIAPPALAPSSSTPRTPPRSSPSTVLGTIGADRLHGGARADRISGGRGADALFGRGGADLLLGGRDSDRLLGGAGADRLAGGAGRDLLYAGPGADRLTGGPGRDGLVGGPGGDTIDAVDGQEDSVRCGPGRDRARADRIDRVDIQCESVQRVKYLGRAR